MRRLLLAFLAVGTLTFALGCSSSRDLPERIRTLQASKNPEILRVGVYGDPLGLHPFDSFENTAAFVAGMVHAGPLRRNGQGEYSGNLWATWTATISNGNLVVEGVWRPNLRWHDGRLFSAEDFVFTLERMKNPQSNCPCQGLAENIVKVETLDGGLRSRVEFKGTSRQFLQILAVGLLPKHLLAGQQIGKEQIAVQRDPLASMTFLAYSAVVGTGTDQSLVDFSMVPVGLGPYRIVGRKRSQFIEMAFGPVASGPEAIGTSTSQAFKEPALKQILARVYYTPDEMVSDIRNGKLDYSFLPSMFVTRIQEMKIPGVKMIGHPNPSYLMLAFNTAKPPFNRREVRQGIDLAINRKRIAELISAPGAILTTPPIVPEEQAVGLQKREFDLLQAEEILTKAGLSDQNGDRIKDWEGKPLTVTLVTNGENFLRKSLAEQIAQDLGVLGIRTVVEAVDWSELFSKHLASGSFDLLLMAYQAPNDGNWINLWHSSPPMGDRLNFTGFANPELDRALEAIDGWPPASNIDQLRQQAAMVLNEHVPGAFLFQPADVVAVSEELSGPSGTGDIWEQDVTGWERVPVSTGAH